MVKEKTCGGGAGERDEDAGGGGESGAKPKPMAADMEYTGTGRVQRGTQVAGRRRWRYDAPRLYLDK